MRFRALLLLFVNVLLFACLLWLTHVAGIKTIQEVLLIIIVAQTVLCWPLAKLITKIMTLGGEIQKINELILNLCEGKYEYILDVPAEHEDESQLIKIKRNLNMLARKLEKYKESATQLYSQEREKASQYKNMANLDSLTKLFNRRGFDKELQRRLVKLQKTGEPFYILLSDLDYFKQVNDTYGHQAGDNILVFMGDVLRKSLRKNDFPCRHGGDEFGIFLDDCPLETAYEIAKRIQNEFSKNNLGVGLSIGGRKIHQELSEKDKDFIMSLVDAVLYKAKKHKDSIQEKAKNIIIQENGTVDI